MEATKAARADLGLVFLGDDDPGRRAYAPLSIQPEPSDRPIERMYGNGRGELELGTCEVSIPREHEVGKMEGPSVLRLEFHEDPQRHIVLQNVHLCSPGTSTPSCKRASGSLAVRRPLSSCTGSTSASRVPPGGRRDRLRFEV